MAHSPQPSPPQHALTESHIDRGGEGAGNVSVALWIWSPRNPSRRCLKGLYTSPARWRVIESSQTTQLPSRPSPMILYYMIL